MIRMRTNVSRSFRTRVVLMGLLVIGSLSFTPVRSENFPNIVLILADDFGYGSAGCYGADGKLVRTCLLYTSPSPRD